MGNKVAFSDYLPQTFLIHVCLFVMFVNNVDNSKILTKSITQPTT